MKKGFILCLAAMLFIIFLVGCGSTRGLSGRYNLVSVNESQGRDSITYSGSELRRLTDGGVSIEFLVDNNFRLTFDGYSFIGTFLTGSNGRDVSLTEDYHDLFHTRTITGEVNGRRITFNFPRDAYATTGSIEAIFEKN